MSQLKKMFLSGRKRITSSLAGRHFLSNALIVIFGAGAAQIIGIAASPLITRLYDPAVFGTVGSAMSIIGLMSPAVTLAYAGAIVLPKSWREANALIWLSSVIGGAFCLIALFPASVVLIGGLSNLPEYLRMTVLAAPFIIFSETLLQVTQQCMIREKRYKETAYFNIIQASVSAGSKIFTGAFIPSFTMLFLSSIIAVPLNAILYLFSLSKSRTQAFSFERNFSDIRKTAAEYKDFPVYRMPQAFIGMASISAPILLLASFVGPTAAGFFALANSVLGAPVQLLTKAINDVFFPRLVEASHSKERVSPLIEKAGLLLLLASFPPIVLISLAGPWLFNNIFGTAWETAGHFAQWLCVLAVSTLILRAGLSVAPIIKIQRSYLVFEVLSTLTKMAALWIPLMMQIDVLSSVAIYSLCGATANVVFFLQVIIAAKRFDRTRD